MKQVLLSGSGQVEVFDVPLPPALPRAVLVRNAYSLISAGTEAAAVTAHGGWRGLYEKAFQSRKRAEQVWRLAQTVGVGRTWELVRSKLQDFTAIGYSSAGEIVEADDGGPDLRAGLRVACMGAGFASHAEYVAVPRNLVAPVPDGVALEEAAFGAIACIALQGIRRLELAPGERVGVIGLGLIGQVCVRLLVALGYDAFGTDLSPERARTAALAAGVTAWATGSVDSVGWVAERTGGQLLDGVVVCAATASDEPANLAFDLCRPQGRVSIVGDVGLRLGREKMYRKELELRMSRSYGPGRYDEAYEVGGHDYPPGYVRWTEGRNLGLFLQLLAGGRLSLRPLASARYPVDEAPAAYRLLKESRPETYGILIDYGPLPPSTRPPAAEARVLRVAPRPRAAAPGEVVRVGLIGIGGYAKGVHIPNLQRLKHLFRIHAVASRSGAAVAAAGRATGAELMATDYRRLLDDREVDAVVVSTRHASHARIVLDALAAGKHVFVEKPMTTTVEDGEAVVASAASTGLVVRVGFNRRFAPYLSALKAAIGPGRRVLTCRVNIGRLADDWSDSPDEGGRLLGEGVHFFDLCNWFMDALPLSLSAVLAGEPGPLNPNASVVIRYPGGSTAQVCYTALGHPALGKERFEAFGNGRAAFVDDFRRFGVAGAPVATPRKGRRDKGQLAELEEFASAVRGAAHPLPGADARAGLLATSMAIAAWRSAAEGIVVSFPLRSGG